MKSFGSDNHSGVEPRILGAIERANIEHEIAYGDDKYTRQAIRDIQRLFGREVEVFFVFNGTGANILALGSGISSFNSIICCDTAHINVDECGAPEKNLGVKVIAITSGDGKLSVDAVQGALNGFGFEHHSQPKFISIAQCTELGTIYTQAEIAALSELAHSHSMYLHMDGARIAGAVVSAGISIEEMTRGVDVLSFGGTKNGMLCGEAVVILNPELGAHLKYQRKQSMQLFSKMRFIGAQFSEYLKDDLWLELARNANSMAQLLGDNLSKYFKLSQSIEANEVFVYMPSKVYEKLKEQYFFYVWNEATDEVRFVCSFDTTPQDVEGLVGAIEDILSNLR